MAPDRHPSAASGADTTTPARRWAAAVERLRGSGLPMIAAGTAAVVTAASGALLISGSHGHAAPNSRAAATPIDIAALDERAELARARAARDRAREHELARKALAEQRRTQAAARAKRAAQRAAAAERRRKLLAARRAVLPVTNYRLTARFGASSRLWSNRHTGLDFAAPSGTPVRAVKAGRVTSAGWDGAYGWKLIIKHDDGTETWYCHLSSFATRSGTVAAGERIGRVGSTGNVTGPHLHLEVRTADKPRDPLRWLRAQGVRI